MATLDRFPLLPVHPAADSASTDSPPCHLCTALCCRYFALQLDTPEDVEDFDALRWYLLHDGAWLWVDDGDWFLQVDRPCRYLGPSNECTIYERRPQICRDYALPDQKDHPDDPLCDYFAKDAHHDHEFRDIPEFDKYVEKFLADRAAARLRRSVAAKRAWANKKRGGGPIVKAHAVGPGSARGATPDPQRDPKRASAQNAGPKSRRSAERRSKRGERGSKIPSAKKKPRA